MPTALAWRWAGQADGAEAQDMTQQGEGNHHDL